MILINSIIEKDLINSFGIECNKITPVTGGWLNKKWKVSSEKGELLVKQYSNKRFSKEKLKSIEQALKRQVLLNDNGIPSPYIWQCEGHIIQYLDNEIAYMVMEFCQGAIEKPNTISIKQMKSLGSVCGAMHNQFSEIPVESVKGFPIDGRNIINTLWENYNKCLEVYPVEHLDEYRKCVIAQKSIIEELTDEFFERLPKGVAHEDFTPDNMLFHEECLSAIIDFDRNQYSFIWHDIGRILLSLTLVDNQLRVDRIKVFIEGYSQYHRFDLKDVIDALRITWCIEIPWWIRPNYSDKTSNKVERFRYEMMWLTEHWFELDSLLSM